MPFTRTQLLTLGAAAIGLFAAAAHPAAAQVNLLANGDFSNPNTGSYATSPTPADWTDPTGQYGVVSNAYLNGYGAGSLPGQSLFLNDADAYQTVSASNFTNGDTYVLTGGVIQNNYDLGYTTPQNPSDFDIYAGDGVSGTLIASGSVDSTSSTAYSYVSPVSFVYASGDGDITVALVNPDPAAGTSSPGQNQSDFGNVDLALAPEPAQLSVFALVALGLGGLIFRARKARAAAV